MDILHQILKLNRLLVLSIIEIMVYTILLSLIIYHLIVYLGRKNYKEGKYYLYFSYYFTGLLLYIFLDTFTYYVTVPKILDVKIWTTFFTAVSYLIIYKSIILILNSSLNLKPSIKNVINKVFNYYALFNLVWISPAFIHINHIFKIFWIFNASFTAFLSIIYISYLIKNSKKIEGSIKIIAWLILSYVIYTIFYHAIWMIFPKAPELPFWIVNNVLKIIVAFFIAYALAKKTNKDYLDLQELKENLEKKVEEKTKELQDAKNKIEENSEQRKNYFINLAHETKTPLTLISNYLDRYIKMEGSTRELDIIKENLDKLKNEMIRFLDVEKYEKGLVSFINTQIVSLSESVKQKAPIYQEYARINKMNFSVEVEDNVFIRGEQPAIDSIINNLFENAVKYSNEGSSIKILLKREDLKACLIVSDTGMGIEKEKLKNIFQPYYQVSQTKLNRQGLGMGLFIVKSIVELLKGRIEVRSVLNEGTEITVRFPIEIAVQADPVSIPGADMVIFKKDRIKTHHITYSAERKNILIVEDNPDMRNYLAEELNEVYNVFIANDGVDAFDMLKTSPDIDIILSDVMMDRMDGHSLFTSLSKNEQYFDIPFIFLTAKSNDKEKLEMLTKGAIDYLYKPFSIDELKAKIQSILINSYNRRTAALKETMKVIQHQILKGKGIKNDNGKWDTFELKKREYGLTERQVEIIQLVEKGLEYKQIADMLNISVKTTHRHIQNLFEKFGVHSKIELMKVLFDL